MSDFSKKSIVNKGYFVQTPLWGREEWLVIAQKHATMAHGGFGKVFRNAINLTCDKEKQR